MHHHDSILSPNSEDEPLMLVEGLLTHIKYIETFLSLNRSQKWFRMFEMLFFNLYMDCCHSKFLSKIILFLWRLMRRHSSIKNFLFIHEDYCNIYWGIIEDHSCAWQFCWLVSPGVCGVVWRPQRASRDRTVARPPQSGLTWLMGDTTPHTSPRSLLPPHTGSYRWWQVVTSIIFTLKINSDITILTFCL